MAFTIWRVFFFQSNNYQISAIEFIGRYTPIHYCWLINRPGIKFHYRRLACLEPDFQSTKCAFITDTDYPNLLADSFGHVRFSMFYHAEGSDIINLILKKKQITRNNGDGKQFYWEVSALLVGGIPFWIANLPLTLVFPWNRFTLALMPGSVLLIVGLLEVFIRTSRQKVILVSILISLAAGWQFYNANTFRREWELSRDFFWQLSWRVPGLKPNTLLLTHEFPFKYYSDNSLTAPINWMYAPDFRWQTDALYVELSVGSVEEKSAICETGSTGQPDIPRFHI